MDARQPARRAGLKRSRGRLASPHELLDLRDDVVDVEVGRVDLVRVLGRPHPGGVALVAQAQVGRERVGADLGPLGQPAAARAPSRSAFEVDLHLGARARRRCRCRGPRSRRRPPRRARAGAPRITSRTAGWRATTGTRRSMPASRIADVTSVSAIKTRPCSSKRDRVLGRRARRAASPSSSGTPRWQREPGQRAVHRAGVEVAEAEPLGEPPGDRALAGPCGPVDGDDHRCVTESSSSKNPGKLTATASASSSSTPSRDDEPGDRAQHRDPMVAVRAHAPTLRAGGYPSHPEAIVARRDADAKGSERSRHGFDAVRFLDAQLLVRRRPRSRRARSRRRARTAAARRPSAAPPRRSTVVAVSSARTHLEVADRLAAARAPVEDA